MKLIIVSSSKIKSRDADSMLELYSNKESIYLIYQVEDISMCLKSLPNEFHDLEEF